MEHQQQYLSLVTVLLLLVYLKYTGVPSSPTPFFFLSFPDFNVDLFLNQELTAGVVRKAALTGAGHDSLCVTVHTGSSDPLLKMSSRVSLWTFLLHPVLLERWAPPFPPTAPCTFPSRRSLQFGS